MTKQALGTVLAVSLSLPTLASFTFEDTSTNTHWPHFRGPNMNAAVADNESLPITWNQTENVEWVAEIPGTGWGSPVVWGNRVFVTTTTSDGAYEEPKAGLYAPRGRAEPPAVRHEWRLFCLDLTTGETLWSQTAYSGIPEFPRHQKSSYAAETPATDGERIYARFGDLGIWAYDMDGNEVWEKRIPFKRTMFDYGSASSPVVHDGKVILLYDNEEESWIAALDTATGKELWRTARDEASSWATPYIWENDQRTEIVTSGRKKIRSYDLDGNLLWQMDGRMSWAAIATPFAVDGLLFVNSGYFQDRHKPVYAIRPGASGDITPAEGELDALSEDGSIAWYQPRAGNYNTSPLVYQGTYYSLLDRGFFEAYDAKSGEPVYGRNRVSPRGGASFTASPWAYNGKIFALSEQGDTFVIDAGPEFRVDHVNELDEMAMASPAIAGGRLLLRTRSKVYSLKQGATLEREAPMVQTTFNPLGTTGDSWGAWINPGAPVEEWLPRALPLCGEDEYCRINVFEGAELATHENPVPPANLRALKWVVTFRHRETPRVTVDEYRAEPGQEKRQLTFD